MSDDSTTPVVGNFFCRLYYPLVVRVVERISGNLLTLTANTSIIVCERVALKMRVQENLRLSVSECNGVKVANFCRWQEWKSDQTLKPVPSTSSLVWMSFIPSASTVRGLPIRVSWNAGLMKSSPVPE